MEPSAKTLSLSTLRHRHPWLSVAHNAAPKAQLATAAGADLVLDALLAMAVSTPASRRGTTEGSTFSLVVPFRAAQQKSGGGQRAAARGQIAQLKVSEARKLCSNSKVRKGREKPRSEGATAIRSAHNSQLPCWQLFPPCALSDPICEPARPWRMAFLAGQQLRDDTPNSAEAAAATGGTLSDLALDLPPSTAAHPHTLCELINATFTPPPKLLLLLLVSAGANAANASSASRPRLGNAIKM